MVKQNKKRTWTIKDGWSNNKSQEVKDKESLSNKRSASNVAYSPDNKNHSLVINKDRKEKRQKFNGTNKVTHLSADSLSDEYYVDKKGNMTLLRDIYSQGYQKAKDEDLKMIDEISDLNFTKPIKRVLKEKFKEKQNDGI